MADLDATDARLLLALCDRPRATGVDLAATLGVARNTVHARLARWDQAGLLSPTDRTVPPAALGYPLQAVVLARADQHRLGEVTRHLAAIPEVLEVVGLSGTYDLHLRLAARDADDLYRVAGLVLAVPGVERTNMSVAIRELVPYRTRPLLRRLSDGG